MKQYVIEEGKLESYHPLWPNEIVYKIFNIKTQAYEFACYTTPDAALDQLDKFNNRGF